MALAKKGTRLMTVEGARYRWVVAPNDESGLGIVVEAEDSPGQRMVTWVDHGTTLSPWLVREAILHALAQGWQPRARGPERVFRFDASSIGKALSRRLESQLSGLCDAPGRMHPVGRRQVLGKTRRAVGDPSTPSFVPARVPRFESSDTVSGVQYRGGYDNRIT
ncbi:MAG TPA: hypothetical protein VEY88_17345 [Archangium sp.]|nr:hypothetical protein [Archangium sp.]